MALAILRHENTSDDRFRFRFDIGKNRYYTYAVGDQETVRYNGLKILREPHFKSPLMGPLPESAMGRGFLEVPGKVIDRDHRYLQLISFRTQDRVGPAMSDIVEIPAGGRPPGELPELTFGQELAMDRANHYVQTVPFRYREAKYSNAMFLNALVSALPSILPAVAPLIGNLFGGGRPASSGGGGGGAPAPLLNAIGSPETVQQIIELIQQIANASATPAAPTTASATGLARTAGLAPTNGYSSAYARRVSRPRRRRRSSPQPPVYSEAQIAPALLAALPALMPILKQVLNPQTIQAVLQAPTQHTSMILDGIKDFAKLGLQSHEQDLQHLRALNPGVADPALDALLASMSLGLSQVGRELNYKRVNSVRLHFDDVHPQTLYGQTKIPYHFGQELAFPFVVETPRTIPKAVLQLLVKDAQTLEILVEKEERMAQASNGRSLTVPTLSEAQVRSLEPNRDYLICLALVWNNRSGAKRGTSIKQKITLVGDYVFDRVEEASELIPLNDVTRFREFWHKIWGGAFTDDVKRFVLNCKYYYALNGQRTSNARLETKMRIAEPEDRRATGQLKTGMDLSPDELNRLIPRLVPGEAPLSEEELRPLRAGDFANRFNQAARYKARLRGRSGDSAALWVYPEFKLQRVVLQKVGQVNANGHILSFSEHPIRFPMPALVHFIGARTT